MLVLIAGVVILIEIRKSKRATSDVLEEHPEPEGEVVVPRLRHALLVGNSPTLATVAFVLKMVEHYDTVDTVDADEAIARLGGVIDPATAVVAVVDWEPDDRRAVEFLRAARSEPAFEAVRILVLVPESQTEDLTDTLAPAAGRLEFLSKPLSTETLRERLGTVASP